MLTLTPFIITWGTNFKVIKIFGTKIKQTICRARSLVAHLNLALLAKNPNPVHPGPKPRPEQIRSPRGGGRRRGQPPAMSSIYVSEPPTKGKVVVKTTMGPLDIELWPKEAPKAVRNFVQLCLEGYYDRTIFHRVIKSFLVQGGDPTGSGTG